MIPSRLDLVLSVQVGVEVVAKRLGRLVETLLLVDGRNLLQVVVVKLEVTLEILLDPRRGLALWNDRLAAGNSPCQRNLGARLAVLLADLDKYRVLDQLVNLVAVDGVLVAEWGVVGDVD